MCPKNHKFWLPRIINISIVISSVMRFSFRHILNSAHKMFTRLIRHCFTEIYNYTVTLFLQRWRYGPIRPNAETDHFYVNIFFIYVVEKFESKFLKHTNFGYFCFLFLLFFLNLALYSFPSCFCSSVLSFLWVTSIFWSFFMYLLNYLSSFINWEDINYTLNRNVINISIIRL